MDDLYRDVLSDSVLNSVGLARGLQERMCGMGLPLSWQQPHLPRINEESVAAQLRHRQRDSLEASLGWTLARAALRERPSVRTGAGSDAQTVSKGIACVLVVSVMPPHPRGHMSFCAFGWDVILYRQSPDAVLRFHDPRDYARYVCTAWETRYIWCLSALP